MMRFAHLYDVAVLWLLSIIGQRVVDTIYKHGHEDGMTELRDFMRRDLTAMHAASATERMRSYNMGYRDAMRYLGEDEPLDDAPIERVM
jgi:hypothetical protein